MYFGPICAWGSKVTTTGKTHGASSTPFYEFKIRWRSILTSSEIYAFLYGFNSSNSTLDYEIDYQRMRTYFLLLGTIVSGQRLNLCQREINAGRFFEVIFDHLWVDWIQLIFSGTAVWILWLFKELSVNKKRFMNSALCSLDRLR